MFCCKHVLRAAPGDYRSQHAAWLPARIKGSTAGSRLQRLRPHLYEKQSWSLQFYKAALVIRRLEQAEQTPPGPAVAH